jgi:hypothetical protein
LTKQPRRYKKQQKMSRVPTDHALIGVAKLLTVPPPTPVLSYHPLTLSTPKRPVDLQLKITFPASGGGLPIILLSHGHGASNHLSSYNGYGPLVNFWASRGFAVIQPTHLSSKALSLPPETPGAPLFFKSRVEDMRTILDRLDAIEEDVPLLKGRLDRERIAVAGHSAGSHTASMLLGATVDLPGPDQEVGNESATTIAMADPRIKAGILLTAIGAPGPDGQELSDFARSFSFFRYLNLSTLSTPSLCIAGADDVSPHLTSRDASWHWDPYTLGKGTRSLVKINGSRHLLGGISGFDAQEAAGQDDEDPIKAGAVARLTWAYLRSALNLDEVAWKKACAEFEETKLGSVEHRT